MILCYHQNVFCYSRNIDTSLYYTATYSLSLSPSSLLSFSKSFENLKEKKVIMMRAIMMRRKRLDSENRPSLYKVDKRLHWRFPDSHRDSTFFSGNPQFSDATSHRSEIQKV
ncbi:Protein CBG25336 [Caenorhabditis briggsae]|uniref:Protein CBG25336 n=1 Tax=Caenorhabditis briggsae TaxID=6238 RepID=B6II00_CAEBR|nr:Protein CBG25336 [Caenorhabditis briggsae]CAR99530.1 Protein CBG25336 [Caenorhabditis briggsae]